MDYVDYGQRDMFFGGQGNPSSASRPPMTPSNSFPPIGTFSLDSASMAAPQSQNTVFGGGDTMSGGSSGGTGTIGVFSSNSVISGNGSGGGSGTINGPSGGISNSSNNSYGGGSQSNSNGADANQGTRETGIIEKLLVRGA